MRQESIIFERRVSMSSWGQESKLQGFLKLHFLIFDKILRKYVNENVLNSTCENCFAAECEAEG